MMELDAHKPKLVDHEATSETSIVELLINTDEELKGKLQIIVDRETLVNTTRVQNKALLFIHNQLKSLQDKLDGVEAKFTTRLDDVEVKLGQCGDRCDVIEKKSEAALSLQDAINAEVEKFKCETTDSLSKTRQSLAVVEAAVQELSSTINISSISDNALPDDAATTTTTLYDTLTNHTQQMEKMEVTSTKEINRVVDWVTDLRKEDERNLNSLQMAMEKMELQLQSTNSEAATDKQIIEQPTEEREEEDKTDFRTLSTLHELLNNMKESKANTSDLEELRDQITQLCTESNSEHNDCALNYNSLKETLSLYESKVDLIGQQLNEKSGSEYTANRLDHLESKVGNILAEIDEQIINQKELANTKDGGGDKGNIQMPSNTNTTTHNTTIKAPPSSNANIATVASSESIHPDADASINEVVQSHTKVTIAGQLPESIRLVEPTKESDQVQRMSVGPRSEIIFGNNGCIQQADYNTRTLSSSNGCSQLTDYTTSSPNNTSSPSRPRTSMSGGRSPTPTRSSQRPCSSPSTLSYDLTPMNKRRSTAVGNRSQRIHSFVVGNSQTKSEDKKKEDPKTNRRPTSSQSISSALQFFRGRAIAR